MGQSLLLERNEVEQFLGRALSKVPGCDEDGLAEGMHEERGWHEELEQHEEHEQHEERILGEESRCDEEPGCDEVLEKRFLGLKGSLKFYVVEQLA